MAQARGGPRAGAHDAEALSSAIGVGAVTKQQIDERIAGGGHRREGGRRGAGHRQRQRGERRPPATAHRGSSRSYAPFDGIITARNVDPGALITSGSTQQTTQLFSLAQVDTLRIFVYVPQADAFDVRVGQSADVALREQPDRVFKGTVTRTAGAIDTASGTLLTEVQVPNHDERAALRQLRDRALQAAPCESALADPRHGAAGECARVSASR